MDMQTMTLIIPVCSKLAVLSSGNPKIHIQYFLFAGSHDPHANVVKNTALIQMQTVFLIKKAVLSFIIQATGTAKHRVHI